MKNFIFIFLIGFFALTSRSYAEGLDTLIDLGRGQAAIQKSYARETATYNEVKRAVDSGSIKKGRTKKEIASKYGQPVVNIREFGTERDEWIYKPAKSTYTQGERIYLFFDKNEILDEVKAVN